MSFPKLSFRTVRKHPAVLTEPKQLQPGMDVAQCYLWSPINRRYRCGQAMMSLIPEIEPEERRTKRARMKEGYNHTPTWGIIVTDVAKVNWITIEDSRYVFQRANLTVTQSSNKLSFGEQVNFRTTDADEIGRVAKTLPAIDIIGYDDQHIHSIERTESFESLGFAKNPYGQQDFVVDLSKLSYEQ